MSEKEIIQRIQLAYSKKGRLFRANSGMGWTGKIVEHNKDTLVLKNPRPFHGMPEGTSDLIGFTTVKITPEMVGKEFAVFTGYEVKVGKLKLTEQQKNFILMVRLMGGIAKVIRTEDDVFQMDINDILGVSDEEY